jgi:hypothetical protein
VLQASNVTYPETDTETKFFFSSKPHCGWTHGFADLFVVTTFREFQISSRFKTKSIRMYIRGELFSFRYETGQQEQISRGSSLIFHYELYIFKDCPYTRFQALTVNVTGLFTTRNYKAHADDLQQHTKFTAACSLLHM